MPGVVCCVFVDDIPGSNATGPIRHDATVFADRQVHVYFPSSVKSEEFVHTHIWDGDISFRLQVTCVGHIIGVVVADTQLHAQRAAKAVSIQYEELPPIVTIQVSHLCIGLAQKCVNVEGKKFLGSHVTKFGNVYCRIHRRPSLPRAFTSQ